jgi:hypothetical protein
MLDRRDSALKSFAANLARSLADGQDALEILRGLGLLAEAPDGASNPVPKPGWVGIWEPRTEDGSVSYQRSRERTSEWTSWADVERIPPKGPRKRVVLIGESVARGYFYDPRLTPARVLEALLEVAGIPGGAEVVDLAKNDLDGLALGALVNASLALQPDAIVLFAGNNWAQVSALVRDWPERHVAATLLREQGVPGLKAYLDEKLLGLFAGRLEGPLVALSARVAIVLMVPEFNLGDWRFGGMMDAPWLPGGANERWLHCFREADQALREERIEEAEVRAREMIELDAGTASAGFTFLAECRRRQGLVAETRELLEKARDSHSWESTVQPPRPLTFVQEALRRAGSQGKIRLVDLPRIFERQLGGELPDRRLFLDYCHLTSEGIRLAMAAVAASLAPVLGGREADVGELAGIPVELDPNVEGEARFAAAIHNAHWGQSWDVVHHHCVKALEASRRTADLMQEYAELQARRTPAWMCAAGERLAQKAGAGPLRRYLHIYMVYNQGKFLDRLLLDAVATALEEAGIPARESLEDLRRRESGLAPGRPADLLDSYYRPAWTNRDWIWRRHHYYRAHAPLSEFAFICSASSPVSLQIVCRRPEGVPPDGPCGLAVNGMRIGDIDATADWRSFRFNLEPEVLREGVNSVEIHWPWRIRPGEEGLQQAARDLEAGLPYELLPLFGEIHSLTAMVAG